MFIMFNMHVDMCVCMHVHSAWDSHPTPHPDPPTCHPAMGGDPWNQ